MFGTTHPYSNNNFLPSIKFYYHFILINQALTPTLQPESRDVVLAEPPPRPPAPFAYQPRRLRSLHEMKQTPRDVDTNSTRKVRISARARALCSIVCRKLAEACPAEQCVVFREVASSQPCRSPRS